MPGWVEPGIVPPSPETTCFKCLPILQQLKNIYCRANLSIGTRDTKKKIKINVFTCYGMWNTLGCMGEISETTHVSYTSSTLYQAGMDHTCSPSRWTTPSFSEPLENTSMIFLGDSRKRRTEGASFRGGFPDWWGCINWGDVLEMSFMLIVDFCIYKRTQVCVSLVLTLADV